MIKMIKFKKIFTSFEGEGPNIGLKTTFLTYFNNEGDMLSADESYDTPAFYINADFIDMRLFLYLSSQSVEAQIHSTYEIPLNNFIMQSITQMKKLRGMFFIKAEEEIDETNIELINFLRELHSNIKIEATKDNFYERLKLANQYATFGFDVFLMPLFSEGVGELMMNNFSSISDKVRVMPPTQFLINMK